MSDYPQSPVTLASMDATLPLSTESLNALDEVLRQTRYLLKEVLKVEHNEDGTHKGISAAQLGTDAVETAKIKDLAVTTAKLAALAVTAAKLAVDAVETDKIKDLNVTTDKLNDLAVTEGKLAAGAVTAAKLAANSVTSGKLAEDAVTDANRPVVTNTIRDGAITAAKIASGGLPPATVLTPASTGMLMVGNAASGAPLMASVIGDLQVVAVVDSPPTVEFKVTAGAAIDYNIFGHYSPSATAPFPNAGAVVAATPSTWEQYPFNDTVVGSAFTISGGRLKAVTAGTYLIHAVVPGYGIDRFQARIKHTGTATAYYPGSAASAPALHQAVSVIDCAVVVEVDDYLDLEIAAETANVYGRGIGLATGQNNYFAQITLLAQAEPE